MTLWDRIVGAVGGRSSAPPADTIGRQVSGDRPVRIQVQGPGGSEWIAEIPAQRGSASGAAIVRDDAVGRVRRAPRRGRRNNARASNYDAAGMGRDNYGWAAPRTGANTEVTQALPVLRARSRGLVRNNGYAERILSVIVANWIGEGIHPRCDTGNRELDKLVNDYWRRWSKRVDAYHELDIAGVQALSLRSMLEGGDCLVRRRPRRLGDGLVVPLQLEVMEGDLLDDQKSGELANGGRVVAGVEFDAVGRRSGYWLRSQHPGEALFRVSAGSYQSKVVPAADIAHLYRPLRAGQVRGVPVLAPVAQEMRALRDYVHAEGVRKRVEACFVAFVVGDVPADRVDDGDGVIVPAVEDTDGNPIGEVFPGMVATVTDGRDVKFGQPAASPDFAGYKAAQVREIASGANVTYEQASGDLAGVNFASYKVGRVEFFRQARQVHRTIIVPKLCEPIWEWFIDAAQVAGLIPLAGSPAAPRGYPARWSEPRFESIERDKDANADKSEIRNGTASIFDVIARTGRDPVDTLEQVAEAFKLLDKLGLVLDVDPRKTSAPGAAAASSSSADTTGGSGDSGSIVDAAAAAE